MKPHYRLVDGVLVPAALSPAAAAARIKHGKQLAAEGDFRGHPFKWTSGPTVLPAFIQAQNEKRR